MFHALVGGYLCHLSHTRLVGSTSRLEQWGDGDIPIYVNIILLIDRFDAEANIHLYC